MHNIKYLLILIIILAPLIFFDIKTNQIISNNNLYQYQKNNRNISEQNFNIDITMCQLEDCEEIFIKNILNANYSINCAFFELNLENLTHALDNAKVKKSVILDSLNHISRSYIIYDNRSAYMHNKFCVIDNRITITGSFNPTYNCKNRNDNNVVKIESSKIANIYNEYYYSMHEEYITRNRTNSIRNHYIFEKNIEICFSRGGNCLRRIHHYINQSNHSIYMILFVVTDDWLGDLLIIKKLQGTYIEGIFERRMITRYSIYDKLIHHGIEIQRDCNPATMHHKVFIIDEEIVITGSFNPSNNAERNNEENMIIIKNPKIAQKYLKEFERIKQLCTT
ncbi:MAG: phospholipase D-like domain-containing protein [Candidatus Woesearchaeota archaeon]